MKSELERMKWKR